MSLQGVASLRLVWCCVLCAAAALALAQPAADREWLAGDSHIHSHWSTGLRLPVHPADPDQGTGRPLLDAAQRGDGAAVGRAWTQVLWNSPAVHIAK